MVSGQHHTTIITIIVFRTHHASNVKFYSHVSISAKKKKNISNEKKKPGKRGKSELGFLLQVCGFFARRHYKSIKHESECVAKIGMHNQDDKITFKIKKHILICRPTGLPPKYKYCRITFNSNSCPIIFAQVNYFYRMH